MNRELFVEDQLFTPGPTPIPPSSLEKLLKNSIYHRSQTFYEIILSCREILKPFFDGDEDPIILTASGTGGLESIFLNCTKENDSIAVINAGKFGERIEKMSKIFRCDSHILNIEDGQACSAEALTNFLKNIKKPIKSLFFQANETSTGVFQPVAELITAAKKVFPDIYIFVDAISALGAHVISMKKFGIDAMVSGSQKGFGAPAGLCFIARSQRMIDFESDRPKFYFDLKKEAEGQEKGRTSWTPAIHNILALENSLKIISNIGVKKFADHHQRLTMASRAAFTAMKLEFFATKNFSHALTSVHIPNKIDGEKFLSNARAKYGAIISGGQDELKGKIFRFSHLGFCSALHVLQGIAAVEWSLNDLKWKFTLGEGMKAAMSSLADNPLN